MSGTDHTSGPLTFGLLIVALQRGRFLDVACVIGLASWLLHGVGVLATLSSRGSWRTHTP